MDIQYLYPLLIDLQAASGNQIVELRIGERAFESLLKSIAKLGMTPYYDDTSDAQVAGVPVTVDHTDLWALEFKTHG